MSDQIRLLEYLQANSQWHYGLDLCQSLDISRGTIYVYLGILEEKGYVERKDEVRDGRGDTRPMYRASRQRGLPADAMPI